MRSRRSGPPKPEKPLPFFLSVKTFLLISMVSAFLFGGTGVVSAVRVSPSGGASPVTPYRDPSSTAGTPASPWRVTDGESLRWEGVHRQQTSKTCGPASVVTLLTYYMGIPVEEEEVARLALGGANGAGEAGQSFGEGPISMRGLQKAMAAFGVSARGLAMSLSGLELYLLEVGLPVIVRITHPEPHFSVVTGMEEGHVVLADSSMGRRALPRRDFLAMWDGIGLVVANGPVLNPQTGGAHRGADAPDRRDTDGPAPRLDHLRRGVMGR